jgi:glutamate--cysteine ligase
MEGICQLLDESCTYNPYSQSLASQREKVKDPDCTPSARMLAEMRSSGESFYPFALRMSRQHQQFFQKEKLSLQMQQKFIKAAEESWRRQQEIEAKETEPFESYLQRYFAQKL